MKLILTLLSLFIGANSFALSIKVKVLEGWKSTPFENCSVILSMSSGKVIEVAVSDANGEVEFNDVPIADLEIHAVDSLGRFENEFPIEVGSMNEAVEIILYPTIFYEMRMIEQEDSIRLLDTIQDSLIQYTDEQLGIMNDRVKRFISENVRYPEISRELGEQGRVYVQYILESNGDITHVEIAHGVSRDLDREAKRIVRAIPPFDFLPKNVRFVRCRIRYPITFTLQ